MSFFFLEDFQPSMALVFIIMSVGVAILARPMIGVLLSDMGAINPDIADIITAWILFGFY